LDLLEQPSRFTRLYRGCDFFCRRAYHFVLTGSRRAIHIDTHIDGGTMANEERKAVLRQLIAARDKDIAGLEAQYGTGCRPEWVGEEIGIETARRDRYQAELDALEAGDVAA